MSDPDLTAINAARERIRATYLQQDRPASSARGLHHFAVVCSDVERTVRIPWAELSTLAPRLVDDPSGPPSSESGEGR